MTHSAIVELLDGRSTDWMEKVSDEEYLAIPSIQRSPEEAMQIAEAYVPHIVHGRRFSDRRCRV